MDIQIESHINIQSIENEKINNIYSYKNGKLYYTEYKKNYEPNCKLEMLGNMCYNWFSKSDKYYKKFKR